ncbi:uncharacterized protein LOC119683413 [Teleopsis dalmanni]|uniref:uncharacterized protein LOC119683413 n=1 Tax=Teleopsis dalmanni TaxID=139649 RepID=UPI0018CD52DF|nr:uncharacterized protein LOC119683413 [Teleopsis dalmanni]
MNITRLKIINACLLFTFICVLTLQEYLRVKYLQNSQSAELKQYIDTNWHMLLDGEWIVDYHNGTADRYTEYGSVWTEVASVMGEKGLSVASIDISRNPILRFNLHARKFPVVYHVIKGVYHVCPGYNDLNAMKFFVEHKRWPFFASIKHAIDELKTEVRGDELWLKYTYVSGCYLFFNILLVLYRYKGEIIKFFKFILQWKSNDNKLNVNGKVFKEKFTDMGSEASSSSEKDTETMISYMILPDEMYPDEAETLNPPLLEPEMRKSQTTLASPTLSATMLLDPSEESCDDASNINDGLELDPSSDDINET